MQRMFTVPCSIHKVTNLLYRVLFGQLKVTQHKRNKIPYILLYLMHATSFLRVNRNIYIK